MGRLRPVRRHRWSLTPHEAIALQRRLRTGLILRGGPRTPRLVAGADVAYAKELGRCYAAAVVLSLPDLRVVEAARAERAVTFPYVPGLLSFREGPAVLAALARLRCRPDFIMFDAQGYAHPRRFGLASHLGYLLDTTSIGCAKSILVGKHDELGEEAGSFAWLVDHSERVGAALRTRRGVRPVYVSPGHRVGFRAAVRLALMTVGKFRVPEPTRLADLMVARLKREATGAAEEPLSGSTEPTRRSEP